MSRDAILGTVRRALGVTGQEATRRDAVAAHLAVAPRGVIPARGQVDRAARLDLFQAMAEAVNASVVRVADPSAVPAAIADYLRANNLPQALRRGEDPLLARLPWEAQAQLEVSVGRAEGTEAVGLSRALAGIAETGTLALASGPDNPTTLAFLPDTHIVMLAADDVVGDMESVWDRLRATYGRNAMPRTLNFITGPSRSADIEQMLLLGAHGPRALHIVLVEAAEL